MNKLFTFMRESNTARFFIPAGLILIIFGVIVLVISIRNQNYIKTEGIVAYVEVAQEAYTDADGNYVDATYNAIVKYSVDGKEYDAELNSVSKYNIGEKTTIYYNPQDPSQYTQTKSIILPIVIIIGGVASLTGGIISAINAVKRYKKMKEQERSWENE